MLRPNHTWYQKDTVNIRRQGTTAPYPEFAAPAPDKRPAKTVRWITRRGFPIAYPEHHQLIQRIETAFDTGTLLFKGVPVWPMLRLMIVTQLNGGSPATYLTDMLSEIRSRLGNARTASERHGILEALYREDEKERQSQLNALHRQIGDVDILAYQQTKELQQIVDGKHFNRLIDSTGAAAKEAGLAFGKVTFEKLDPDLEVFLPAAFVRHHETIRCLLVRDVLDGQVSLDGEIDGFGNFDDFHRTVERICGFSIGSKKQTLLTLARQFYLAHGFAELLRTLRAKLFVLSAFYGGDEICMIYGAHLAGVTSADIQHGKIGLQHAFYKDWPSTPADGFPMIPDVFLVWDKLFSDQIDNGQSQVFGKRHHRPIVTGNPWLWFWNKHLVSGAEGQSTVPPPREIPTVLFSLQWPFRIENMKAVPDNLIRALNRAVVSDEADADFLRHSRWIFRAHPMMSEDVIENVMEDIAALPLSEVHLQLPSEEHLFDVLMKTDVHVTQFSTVAHEASAVGVPTVFIHQYALDNDRALIDSGIATFVPDDEQIIGAIASSLDAASESNYRSDLQRNADVFPAVLKAVSSEQLHP